MAFPTDAYADFDTLQDSTQFIYHEYSNANDQQFGGSKYWNDVTLYNIDLGAGMVDVMGPNTTNYQEQYLTSGVAETVVKNKLVVYAGNVIPSGHYCDLTIASPHILRKGMKVYFQWGGYIMGGRKQARTLNSYGQPVSSLPSGQLGYSDYIWVFDQRYYSPADDVKWLARTIDGRNINVEIDEHGYWTVPDDINWLVLRWKMQFDGTPNSATRYYCITRPHVYIMNFESSINQQTQDVMSTDGADTITEQPQQYVSEVTGKLGFVQQSTETVSSIVTAVLATEPTGGFEFPGISWNGFSLPRQWIALTGYLPSELENRIIDFTTMLFTVAWLHGMVRAYRYIMDDMEKDEEE